MVFSASGKVSLRQDQHSVSKMKPRYGTAAHNIVNTVNLYVLSHQFLVFLEMSMDLSSFSTPAMITIAGGEDWTTSARLLFASDPASRSAPWARVPAHTQVPRIRPETYLQKILMLLEREAW